MFQIGVIQGNVPLSVGALSYAGEPNFDVAVDVNLVPDVGAFSKGMADDLERLGARSVGGTIAVAPGGARPNTPQSALFSRIGER